MFIRFVVAYLATLGNHRIATNLDPKNFLGLRAQRPNRIQCLIVSFSYATRVPFAHLNPMSEPIFSIVTQSELRCQAIKSSRLALEMMPPQT